MHETEDLLINTTERLEYLVCNKARCRSYRQCLAGAVCCCYGACVCYGGVVCHLFHFCGVHKDVMAYGSI